MKVKEVDRTANIAWSPASQVPVYLAAGTAAQQLDATFSTSSCLEIYSLNLAESGHGLPCVASLPVDQRFHKLVWGSSGMADDKMPNGLIVGGSDRGVISMYDANKLIKGENSKVFSEDKHTGPVTALDFNPFQSNLLASGGSESEIYIWDVNKTTAPMTPGPKSQPMDDVRCIAWNRQVQHILASSFASRCLVWDLRKNDPIIKVSDSTSRMRCKVVAWHPDVATQLCLASEDDHTPVIQIWDLRLASSPLKTLEGHTKGILSLAWCKDDSDLLLSCGKDNRIIVWNPNSPQGEIVAELPTSNQWSFDVSWCPRNPAIIASASFDGHVSMYSLMGGQQQVQPTNSITDSFGPGMEALPQQTQKVTMQLKSPPKWLRRPCGASFGFGGQLISFENLSQQVTNQQGVAQTQFKPQVYMSRVVTEQELVDRSVKLETSLMSQNHAEFCASRVEGLEGTEEGKVWRFIGASFSQDPANEYLQLLGLNLQEVKERLGKIATPANQNLKPEMDGVAADISCMGISDTGDEFDTIAETIAESKPVPTSLDLGFDLEVDEAIPEGQLSLALLTGNMELAVNLCVQQQRWGDALILATQGGGDLLVKTQALYFQRENAGGGTAALVEAVAMDAWERLVTNADLKSWKEVLSALVVYCDLQRRLKLAAQLAGRLASGGPQYKTASTLAYIVAADLEHVVEMWIQDDASPQQLQDMVEVVVMLRSAIQNQGITANLSAESRLASSLARYATLLASQGCLSSALIYLGDTSSNVQLQELKQRLETAVTAPKQPASHQAVSATSSLAGGSRPGSRRPSHHPSLERKVSDPNRFNTGLPSSLAQKPGLGAQQPNTNQYSQPPVNNYMQPQPPSSSYPEPSAVPTFQPPPPGSDASSASAQNNPLLKSRRVVDQSINGPGYGGYNPASNYNQVYQPPASDYAGQNGFNNYNQTYGQQPNQYQPMGGQQQTGLPMGGNQPSNQPMGGLQQPSSTQPMGGQQFAMAGLPQPIAGAPPSVTGVQPAIFTPESQNLMNLPSMQGEGRTRTMSQSSTGGPGIPQAKFVHTPDHGGPGHTPTVSSGPGWNDPPLMMTSPKPVVQPAVSSSFNTGPITTPFVGGIQPQDSMQKQQELQPPNQFHQQQPGVYIMQNTMVLGWGPGGFFEVNEK